MTRATRAERASAAVLLLSVVAALAMLVNNLGWFLEERARPGQTPSDQARLEALFFAETVYDLVAPSAVGGLAAGAWLALRARRRRS